MNNITSKTQRSKLKPRREPYWHKLQVGGYLGYRRTNKVGTWLARCRTKNSKQQYESFGELSEYSDGEQFDEAQKLCWDWFKSIGVNSDAAYTINDAIDDYVKYIEINNSPESAKDTRQRLTKHAKPKLGEIRITKLTMADVSGWRDSLVRLSDDSDDVRKSKDGANRLLSMLKAGLNLAYRKDIVGSDKAWRRVSAFKDVSVARKIFLTNEQAQSLFEATKGSFHNLVKSALLTGARYGEIANAKVEDFDPNQSILRLDGKTGPRNCYLSNETLEHLTGLTIDKLPSAFLHIKEDGSNWGKAHQQRPMRDAVAKAKLSTETTFYALRHTHISRALLAGVNAQVIAENCGTSVRMIEKHYGKFMQSDRCAMFNKVKII